MAFIRSMLRSAPESETGRGGYWAGEGEASAGVQVTESTALTYGPFFDGVQIISGDLGSLPLHTYERLERGKKRATDHPLYQVLHSTPNPMMTAVTFRETVQGHALTWGTGFAYIERTGGGHVDSLWPLPPNRVKPVRIELEKGAFTLGWKYTPPNGPAVPLLAEDVLHIPGFGGDGITGYSVVKHAAKAIGLGLATEAYGSSFFSNGSRPGGVLTHPGNLSDPARTRMRTDWENLHRGLDRASRVAILEEGVSWEQIGIPPEDAQFLETRKFQVTEIARYLRLPPHKLGDLDRATFTNIEEQGQDYINSALRIWLVRWEQAISQKLLTAQERRKYFAEHLLDGLLRGDIKTRYEAYAIGRNWGWLSADDVSEIENRNPLPDGKGGTYLVPLNMVEALPPAAAEEPERMAAARALRGRGMEARRRIAAAFTPLVVDVDERLAKLERAEVASLVRRILDTDRGRADRDGSMSSFLSSVWELYDTVVRGKALDRWTPVMMAFATEVVADAIADVGFDGEVNLDTWVRAYVSSHTDYRVNSAFGQIRAAAERAPDDPASAILAKLDEWVDKRPDKTARWETSQLPNAAARETYKAAGIRKLRWVTVGDDCPFCQALDGKVVGIDEAFAAAGTEVGLAEKLQVPRTTLHPPLHPDCDCQVVPE